MTNIRSQWMALLLLAVGGFLVSARNVQAQATTVPGKPGVATYRSVMNFKGTSIAQQRYGWTNLVKQPPQPMLPDVPRPGGDPQPLASLNAPPPLLSYQNGGGGGGAPSPGVTPLPEIGFPALGDNNTVIPPDTHGAVGRDHLMTTLNSEVRIQDRMGTNISTVILENFWLTVGSINVFDPKVLYDHFSDRFMFTAMADARTANSSVLMGVSQTGDPTGNWFLYRIDADTNNFAWADFPSFGFNKDWIVVSVNMFDNFFDTFAGVNIYTFNKTNLYAGGVGQYTLLQELSGRGFVMTPAVVHDPTLATLPIVEVDNLLQNFSGLSSLLRVSEIVGPVGAEQLLVGTATVNATNVWFSRDPIFFPGFLPQQGSPFGIIGNDTRIQNVVYRNGSLWCTHTAFLPANFPTKTVAQWWQFLPNGTLQQFGRVEDPSGFVSYAFPSIAVNRCDDVLIGFSRFSTNSFASAAYAFRAADDPPNTMRGEVILKAGEGPYYKDFQFGFGRNRWGDYSMTMMDPLNDLDFWTIQEYASLPNLLDPFGFQGRWGTWWGKVPVVAVGSSRFEFASSAPIVNEAPPPGFATIEVLNIGGAAGSVDYFTSDGTALSGIDYLPASGTLVFAQGQFAASFSIQIFDNPDVNPDKTVNLSLSNPLGGAVLGCIADAILTIVDDESQSSVSTAGEFNFSSFTDLGNPYICTENESFPTFFCGDNIPPDFSDLERSTRGVRVTVVRTNGSTGRCLVDYATIDGGTAIPFQDYVPVSGTLVFDDFQMSTNFIVPILNNFFIFGVTNQSEFINMVISNPRPAPEEELERPGVIRPTLGPGSVSGITIFSTEFGLCLLSGTTVTNLALTCENAFSWERMSFGTDEYNERNPVVPSNSKTIRLTVLLLPEGGQGSVQVRFFNHVSGFPLRAGSDYAAAPAGGSEILPNPVFTDPSLSTIVNVADYTPGGFTLSFGNGVCRRYIDLVINNDSDVEFNEDIIAELIPIPNNPPVNFFAGTANVTIMHDDQPAGALDREWNPDNNPYTTPSFNPTPGANNTVYAVAVQPDSKSIIGGDFTSYNAQPKNRIARLNFDGSLDESFNPGTGADDFVSSISLYPVLSLNSNRVLIAGGFTSVNGSQRNGIARLLANGNLDPSFVPGNGANGAIIAMAMMADERIVLAGTFSQFNNVTRNGMARLHGDGSLDLTFDPGKGPLGTIWSLALVPDALGGQKVLAGGDFFFFNDEFRAGLVQLLGDGSIDFSFNPGGGTDGPVFAIGIQNDNKILIGGAFAEYDARRRISIARVNPDGALDESFDPGSGPNNPIFALTIQPNQKTIIGGPFTEFNGTRRIGLARLRTDGALDTSFMDTAYNQFAGLINPLSFQQPNFLNAIALQPDGNVMIGGSFSQIGGNPSYTTPLRVVNPLVLEDASVVFTRADKRPRFNIARVIGGNTPGPGNLSFETQKYFASENAGISSIKLIRADGRLGSLIGEAATLDRTAINNLDYSATNLVAPWPEGFYQTNINRTFPIQFPTNFAPLSVGSVEPIFLTIPILDDNLQEGDETLDLTFLRPGGQITLGGEFIPLGGALGRSSSSMVIADNDFSPGRLSFAATQYFTNENSQFAVITVLRTEGNDGRVTVDYLTTTNVLAPRAIEGTDFLSASNTITFQSGQTSAVFPVRIRDDTVVEFDENIGLILTNATGGARLGVGNPTSIESSILTIVDNDFPPGRLNFSDLNFVANEADGAAEIRVTRTGGNLGAISVQFATGNGTALSGLDYTSTNGVIAWNDGENLSKTFRVPLLTDGLVEGPQTVILSLFGSRVGSTLNPDVLGLQTNALLVIEDADAYGQVAFSQSGYQADENGGSILITVNRRAGMAESGSVDFFTTADSAVPGPGQDYENTSGTLNFLPGELSKSFLITLHDDVVSDGNKTITLNLTNAVSVSLGLPNPVTLTLIDNESFNEPAGSADVGFFESTQANGPVLAMDLQKTNGIVDGRILVAGDFTDFNQVIRNRMARLNPDGTLDTSFNPGPGANGAIRAIAAQPDGKMLLGGFFTEILGTNRSGIGRLSSDGLLDSSFNPGAGADNPVYTLQLQPDNKILVGGAFSTFNGISRPGIVRLNTNGIVDASFDTGTGPNNAVWAVALENNGKVLIGGDFTEFNGQTRRRIARLNANGSLDATFSPPGGMNASVRAIAVQADGRILVGGSFTNVNGVTRNFLARLLKDGNLDGSYMAGQLGGDNAVFDVALQVDGRAIVVGDFLRFNGVSRNRITRLNVDGTTDPTINFGSGANSFIATTLIQPDRKILIGGGFTTYNNRPRLRIARLHGGSLAGNGQLEFSQPELLVDEDATNAVVAVRRLGGTTGQVTVGFRTRNGTAMSGTDYLSNAGTLTFPQAETSQSFLVPIINNTIPNEDRFFTVELIDGTLTGGATMGPQPLASVVIVDDEATIGFAAANINISEGIPSSLATITVRRTGATNVPVSVAFETTNGTATAFADYFPTNGILTFRAGETLLSFHVPLINDTNIEGNETVVLTLRDPGNSNTLAIAASTLLILDNDFGLGQFQFATNSYTVLESAGTVVLSVIRTNGSTGIVSVRYHTTPGSAVAPTDFPSTNNILAFADGETVKNIEIPIVNDVFFELPESFNVELFEPGGGATMALPTNTVVNVVDDDTRLIVAAGSQILAESLTPPNNVIDPGERVTISLALRNVGPSDTLNLTAQLLASASVSAPSPATAQSYGILTANGPPVSRSYSFTALGNTGDRLTLTLQVLDGPTTNGFVNFDFTLSGRAVRTFSNTNLITINDNAVAAAYPSTITVANLGGVITNVSVTFSNLTHAYPGDIDALLSSPTGLHATLMSDAGAGFSLNNVNLNFDPRATVVLPEFGQIISQAYLPTNYAGFGTADTFPQPAPLFPYTNSALSVFNNLDPNGVWSLFVVDDDTGDVGSIAGGWSITFATSDPIVPAADVGIQAFALDSSLLVGGATATLINVTNYGPSQSSGVKVQNALPPGFSLSAASTTQGTWKNTGGNLQFEIGTLPSGGGASILIESSPMQTGQTTNVLKVTSQGFDPILMNNQVIMINRVMEANSLTFQEESGALLLHWPVDSGYILQSSESLTPPVWTDVSIAPTVINGQNRVIILIDHISRFYRLRAPSPH